MSVQREMTLQEWMDKLPPMHSARKEWDSQKTTIAEQAALITRMRRTLELAGHTDEGGELWKPPLGPSASPLLDKIDEQAARIAELEEYSRAGWATADRHLKELGEARARIEEQAKP